MPGIRLVRLFVVIALFGFLSLSGLAGLDPFQNRLLDYPRAIPTLTSRPGQVPTLTLHSPALQPTIPTRLKQSLAALRPTPATIAMVIQEGSQSRTSSTTTTTSTVTKRRRSADTDTPTVTTPTPAAPVSSSQILEETYQEIYGDEKYRVGYQLTEQDTYMKNVGCTDGMGSISGTYCAPDGSRHWVAVASTQKASSELTEKVAEKVAVITDEELIATADANEAKLACDPSLESCQEKALNLILDQTLILGDSTKQAVIDNRAKYQAETKTFSGLFDQATRTIDPETFIADCLERNSYADDAAEHCQGQLSIGQKALSTLSQSGVPEDDQKSYYIEAYDNLVQAQAAIKAEQAGNSAQAQRLRDQIEDENIRAYTESILDYRKQLQQAQIQAEYSETLANSLDGCDSITSPDVRNACLQRYAGEKEQNFYSYDGSTVDRSVTPTLQQSYFNLGLITEDFKESVDKNISERVATSELSYLINQMDLGRSTTAYTPVTTRTSDSDGNRQTTAISALLSPLIETVSDSNPQKVMLSCRAQGNIFIPSGREDGSGNCVKPVSAAVTAPVSDQRTQFSFASEGENFANYVSCGQSGQPICNEGSPCDPGLAEQRGRCELDSLYVQNSLKAQTIAEQAVVLLGKPGATPEELNNYVQSLALVNNLNLNLALAQFGQAVEKQLGCQAGITYYSDITGKFDCLSVKELENEYADKFNLTLYEPGGLKGKCQGIFNTCSMSSLECDRVTDTCELTSGTIHSLAYDHMTDGYQSSGLTKSQLDTLEFNSLFIDTSLLTPAIELAKLQVAGVTRDDTFFAGGGCWQAIDPGNSVVMQLPMDYCRADTKTTLLSTMPTKQCHDLGGYYTRDGCEILPPNTEFATLGEPGVDNYSSRYVKSHKVCAPGLVSFNGICREELSLAYDPDYANGVLAKAWTDNVNIPIVKEWIGSALRSLELSTYHDSIDVRADYNLTLRRTANNSGLRLSPNFHDTLTGTLDQAAAARETLLVSKANMANSDDFWDQTWNGVYRAGINTWQFLSAYTGEPPISRGGAAGTNAFYEYAAKNEQINAEDDGYQFSKRFESAAKPAIQASFFAADVVPGAAALGRSLTKAGTQTTSVFLRTAGLLLEAPEKALVTASRQTVGRVTVLPVADALSAAGRVIGSSPGGQTVGKAVTNFSDNFLLGFSEKATYNKLVTNSLDTVIIGLKGADASVDDILRQTKQLARESALDSGNRLLKNTPPTDLEVLISRYLNENSAVTALKQGERISANSLKAAKFVSEGVIIPEGQFDNFTAKFAELDDLALRQGPLSDSQIVKHFDGILPDNEALRLANLGKNAKSVWAGGENLIGENLSVSNYSQRLQKQLGLAPIEADNIARSLAANPDSLVKKGVLERLRLPSLSRTAPITITSTADLDSLNQAITKLDEIPPTDIETLSRYATAQSKKLDDILELRTYQNRNYSPASVTVLNNSSVPALRIAPPQGAPQEVVEAVTRINTIIDEVERINHFRLSSDQVRLIATGNEGLMVMEAGGGKTSVIARALGARDGRAIFSGTTETEALEFINDHILRDASGYFERYTPNVYYINAQRGWLKVELKPGQVFDPARAIAATSDELTEALAKAATGEAGTGVYLVTNRSNMVWQRLGLDPNYIALNRGHFGSYTMIPDEISDDILSQLASSNNPISIGSVRDSAMIGNLKNGQEAVSIYEEVYDQAGSFTVTRRGSGVVIADPLAEAKELSKLISQTENKFNGIFNRTRYRSELTELANVRSLLDDAATPDQLKEAAERLHTFLTNNDTYLSHDLTFRKSSLNSIKNIRGKTPGVDYLVSGTDIVLGRKSGITGETFSLITDQLALYTEGKKLLGSVADSVTGKLDNLTLSSHGNSMTVRDYYLSMQKAGHKLLGLDATPAGASNALGMNLNGTVEGLPLDHIRSLTSYADETRLIDNVQLAIEGDPARAHMISINDQSLSYQELIDGLQARNPSRNEIYIVQYKNNITGSEIEEFIKISPDGTTNLITKDAWDRALHESLKSNPENILVFNKGRSRALDIKVKAENLDLAWQNIGPRDGFEGASSTVMDELTQQGKRQRLLVDRQVQIVRDQVLNDPILFAKYGQDIAQVDAAINYAQDFNLFLHENYGLPVAAAGQVDDVIKAQINDTFLALHNQKLGEIRLTTTITDLATSQERALQELQELLYDPVAAAKLSNSEKRAIQTFIDSSKGDAVKFKNLYLGDISRDALGSQEIYETVYKRAVEAQAKLERLYTQLDNTGVSDSFLSDIRVSWGLDNALPSSDEFVTLLSTPTTTLTSVADQSPAGVLNAFARNNTLDSTANAAFKLSDSSYISPLPQAASVAPQKIAAGLVQAQHPVITRTFARPGTAAFDYLVSGATPLRAVISDLFRPQYTPTYITNTLTNAGISQPREVIDNFLAAIPTNLSRSEINNLSTTLLRSPLTQQDLLGLLVINPTTGNPETIQQILDNNGALSVTLADSSVADPFASDLPVSSITDIEITTTAGDQLVIYASELSTFTFDTYLALSNYDPTVAGSYLTALGISNLSPANFAVTAPIQAPGVTPEAAVPTLSGQPIAEILASSDFVTLGFVHPPDSRVSVFYKVGDQLLFMEEGRDPIPLSSPEEALSHLPTQTAIKQVLHNDNPVPVSEYLSPTAPVNTAPTLLSRLRTLGQNLVNFFRSPTSENTSLLKQESDFQQTELQKVQAESRDRRDKLIYYLTGKLWNGSNQVEIASKVIEDRLLIRQKYNLPNRAEIDENPREYLRKLENIAREKGVTVRKGYEFEALFAEAHRGAYDAESDQLIVSDKLDNPATLNEYRSFIFVFEHELIHALQERYYPSMPIELKEYEAYATADIGDYFLKSNPNDALVTLFQMKIPGSVKFYHAQTGTTPIWDKIILPQSEAQIPQEKTLELNTSTSPSPTLLSRLRTLGQTISKPIVSLWNYIVKQEQEDITGTRGGGDWHSILGPLLKPDSKITDSNQVYANLSKYPTSEELLQIAVASIKEKLPGNQTISLNFKEKTYLTIKVNDITTTQLRQAFRNLSVDQPNEPQFAIYDSNSKGLGFVEIYLDEINKTDSLVFSIRLNNQSLSLRTPATPVESTSSTPPTTQRINEEELKDLTTTIEEIKQLTSEINNADLSPATKENIASLVKDITKDLKTFDSIVLEDGNDVSVGYLATSLEKLLSNPQVLSSIDLASLQTTLSAYLNMLDIYYTQATNTLTTTAPSFQITKLTLDEFTSDYTATNPEFTLSFFTKVKGNHYKISIGGKTIYFSWDHKVADESNAINEENLNKLLAKAFVAWYQISPNLIPNNNFYILDTKTFFNESSEIHSYLRTEGNSQISFSQSAIIDVVNNPEKLFAAMIHELTHTLDPRNDSAGIDIVSEGEVYPLLFEFIYSNEARALGLFVETIEANKTIDLYSNQWKTAKQAITNYLININGQVSPDIDTIELWKIIQSLDSEEKSSLLKYFGDRFEKGENPSTNTSISNTPSTPSLGAFLPAGGAFQGLASVVSAPFTALWTSLPSLPSQIYFLLQPGTWQYGFDQIVKPLFNLGRSLPALRFNELGQIGIPTYVIPTQEVDPNYLPLGAPLDDTPPPAFVPRPVLSADLDPLVLQDAKQDLEGLIEAIPEHYHQNGFYQAYSTYDNTLKVEHTRLLGEFTRDQTGAGRRALLPQIQVIQSARQDLYDFFVSRTTNEYLVESRTKDNPDHPYTLTYGGEIEDITQEQVKILAELNTSPINYETLAETVNTLAVLAKHQSDLYYEYAAQITAPPNYVYSHTLLEGNDPDYLAVTRQDNAIPVSPGHPFWGRFIHPGYSSWGLNGPLTHSQVLAKMKDPNTRVVVLATGLDSDNDQWQHIGSSIVHALYRNSQDPDNLLVIAVNGPGFGLSAMHDDMVNVKTVSTSAYLEFLQEFAKELGIPKDRSLLAGHSMAGEMATYAEKLFDRVIAINPALHAEQDPIFTTLSVLDTVGLRVGQIDHLGLTSPLINFIRNGLTRNRLQDGAGYVAPAQLLVHENIQVSNPKASNAKKVELAPPDPDLALEDSLATHFFAYFSSHDKLTPWKAAIQWYSRYFAARGMDQNLIFSENYSNFILGGSHVTFATNAAIAEDIARRAHTMFGDDLTSAPRRFDPDLLVPFFQLQPESVPLNFDTPDPRTNRQKALDLLTGQRLGFQFGAEAINWAEQKYLDYRDDFLNNRWIKKTADHISSQSFGLLLERISQSPQEKELRHLLYSNP